MGFFGHLMEFNGGLMGFNGAEASGDLPQLWKISIRLTISLAMFNGYATLPKGNDNVYMYTYNGCTQYENIQMYDEGYMYVYMCNDMIISKYADVHYTGAGGDCVKLLEIFLKIPVCQDQRNSDKVVDYNRDAMRYN